MDRPARITVAALLVAAVVSTGSMVTAVAVPRTWLLFAAQQLVWLALALFLSTRYTVRHG